jgi:hypothetical protein
MDQIFELKSQVRALQAAGLLYVVSRPNNNRLSYMVHELSDPDTVRILLVVCRCYSHFHVNNPYGISYEDSTGLDC